MSCQSHWRAAPVLVPALLVLGWVANLAQATFEPLADLPGGADVSWAAGCSADATIVAGYGYPSGGRATRWDASASVDDLGTVSRTYSSAAEGISADGTPVVGQSDDRQRSAAPKALV